MSPGVCRVEVRAPASPATVEVRTPASPAVVQVVAQGQPGPAGPEGPVGPPNTVIGGGSVTYGRRIADHNVFDPAVRGLPLRAGEPQQLVFIPDPDPRFSYEHLNPPFAGWVWWDGSKVVGRALADRIEVQVNLILRAEVADGTIGVKVDVGSTAGPITAANYSLIEAAGDNERVTLLVRFETLDGVMRNGAKLILTSTVNVGLFRTSVIVAPQSDFPGTP